MKRIKFICTFLFVPVFITLLFAEQTTSEKMVTTGRITGRIIYHSSGKIEVKRRSREYIIELTEKTRIMKNTTEIQSSDLAICQVVEVYYEKRNSNRNAVTIKILKESNCLDK